MTPDDVLVVGATGTQGGAVVDALQAETEITVHALTRDSSKELPRSFEKTGISVVQGDLADRDRMLEVMQDVDAVFGVTDFWEHGYEDEVLHGTNLVEAADEAGVEHLVFSSVGGAERDSGIPHFESKRVIEEAIDDHGLPATILRPVFLMQNVEGMREAILDGTLAMGLAPHVPLQMLDVEDLGALAAQAFTHPDEYIGEAIEVASDELTLQAAAARFAAVTGRQVDAQHLSPEKLRAAAGEESVVMFAWFNEHGYEADLSQLRSDHEVAWTRFETYLQRAGWAKASQG